MRLPSFEGQARFTRGLVPIFNDRIIRESRNRQSWLGGLDGHLSDSTASTERFTNSSGRFPKASSIRLYSPEQSLLTTGNFAPLYVL
jgi:hypothetical protein